VLLFLVTLSRYI